MINQQDDESDEAGTLDALKHAIGATLPIGVRPHFIAGTDPSIPLGEVVFVILTNGPTTTEGMTPLTMGRWVEGDPSAIRSTIVRCPPGQIGFLDGDLNAPFSESESEPEPEAPAFPERLEQFKRGKHEKR